MREAAVPIHRGGVVLGVPDLDPIQAAPCPRRDEVVAIQRPGMREDGDPARLAHDRGRLLQRHARLGDVGGRVMPQVALEGLVEGLDVSRAQEGLGHVRPSQRSPARDLLHLLERDPDPEALEPREDLAGALAPSFTIAADRGQKRGIGLVESVGQEVDVHALLADGELDARDEADPETARARGGGGQPVQGVVVREREDLHAVPRGHARHLVRRERAVRGVRVHVEIDRRHVILPPSRASASAP